MSIKWSGLVNKFIIKCQSNQFANQIEWPDKVGEQKIAGSTAHQQKKYKVLNKLKGVTAILRSEKG